MMLNDYAAHYLASFARRDWHFSMDDDPETAAVSRKKVLEMVASEQMPIVAFHLPFPSIGHVEAVGKGYYFHAAAYQFNL